MRGDFVDEAISNEMLADDSNTQDDLEKHFADSKSNEKPTIVSKLTFWKPVRPLEEDFVSYQSLQNKTLIHKFSVSP